MVELKIKKDDEEITLVDKEDIENALDEKVDNSDLSDYYTKFQSNTEYSITVEKQSTADTGFFSTYVIKQNDIQKGVKINVPKDFLVKSTTVKTCNTANSPVSGYEVGDKYIDFVINSKDSTDTDEHLYLATKEIGAYPVDEVTLTVANGKLAIKDNGVTWAKLATVVQNTINGKEDTSNKVTSVSASSTNTQYPSAKCVYDTFCQGNDPRLSDARTPKSHSHNLKDLNIYADGQGGTNLIEGTQDFITPLTNVGLIEGTYQNCKYRRVNNTSGITYSDIRFNIPAGTFKHGEKYTLSFWAKGTGNIVVHNYGNTNYITTKPINCTSGGTNTTNFSAYNDGNVSFTLTSEWKRYFVTWELNPTNNSTNNASVDKMLILRTLVGTHAYYAGVMYERGEVPHDWSPNPKDTYREYIIANSTSIADLDNYRKAGFYYNDNNNEANYIIHCPNSNGTNTPYTNNHGFFLLVEDWGNNTFSVKQTLTYYDDDTIYIRRYVNGTWGTWKKTLNSSNYSTYALSNANGAVLNANIGNNQVNNAKLSDNSVSTSKIQNGAVTNDKLAPITDNKLTYDSSVYNGLSPIDMSMIDASNANRLAFMPTANIQVKVSTNGGSTWSDYPSITNDIKLRMVSKAPDETTNLYSGGTTTASANNQIRVILDAGEITSSKNSDIYCSTGKKLMIAFTTNNASGTKVTVDMASYANPTSWVNAGTYNVGGWWGWNSIPFPYIFGGYQGQQTLSDHYRYIRLTFTHTGGSENPIVKAVRLYAPISYISPSNYAKYGHIYTYDTSQNVTFPAKIIKSGGTSSQFLKANGDVETLNTTPFTVTYTNGTTSTINFVTR